MEITDVLVISMFATFLASLFMGIPIAYGLWGIAIIFSGVGYLSDQFLDTFTGLNNAFLIIAVQRIFKYMQNSTLVALPMFIFMGLMLEISGLAERLMKSSERVFGNLRGGIAISATLIGILLAASTGIIGASVVMLGMLSLPTMLKEKYNLPFSAGTVCAAGTLGILIPPSIMLVVMADQLGLSVGDLFFGAFGPGMILSLFYLVYIVAWTNLNRHIAPRSHTDHRITLSEIVGLCQDILPVLFLMFVVLGSIFAGVATVTEASGVGAFATILLALINKKLSFTQIAQVSFNTFKTTGYIFAILIGATVFALVLRALGGDETIIRGITALEFDSKSVVLFIIACVFILGFFLDWLEISLIILPLVAPVIVSMDISVGHYPGIENPSLVWASILIAVTLQTSFLTPPVGFAIFYLKGIQIPDLKLKHIYVGVIPFVILQILVAILIYMIPDIVLYLPSLMYR